MMPSVAILTPCFNAMPYLPQAMASALAQTHAPVAMVVVDDGSTDESPAWLAGFAAEHPGANVHVVTQANQGEVPARNAGLAAIASLCPQPDWVAMLDADDWWEPDKLQKQLDAAATAGPDCVLVHTGGINEYADGRSIVGDMTRSAKRVGWCLQALLEEGSITHPSIMVRLDALLAVGGYDTDFPHACDVNLYFQLSRLGTFAFVPEPLVHYRIHPRQTSFNFKLDQVQYQVKVVRDFFARHPEKLAEIGQEKIDRELTRFIELKLQSLYWRRRMGDFRTLLAFAEEHHLRSMGITAWRRRARVPDWLIHLKDRLPFPPQRTGSSTPPPSP